MIKRLLSTALSCPLECLGEARVVAPAKPGPGSAVSLFAASARLWRPQLETSQRLKRRLQDLSNAIECIYSILTHF